jgi:hypothetical protein
MSNQKQKSICPHHPWQISRTAYEKLVFDHYCPTDLPSPVDAELLKKVHSEGGIDCSNGRVSIPDCPIPKKDWNRLKRKELVENRGSGWRCTMKATIAMSWLDGVNPWLGGPIKTHETIVRQAVAKGLNVPDAVLAEYSKQQGEAMTFSGSTLIRKPNAIGGKND